MHCVFFKIICIPMLVQKMSFTKCRHLRLDCLLFFWGNATDAQVGNRKKKFGEMKWPTNVFDVRDPGSHSSAQEAVGALGGRKTKAKAK